MNRLIGFSVAALLASTVAFADSKPSAEERAMINDTLAAMGCDGGEYEKEDDGKGIYEIDDAVCKDGKEYDIKLDANFKLVSKKRD